MSQPLQVPQLLIMPIANQNMYYYSQNPSKLVNQIIMPLNNQKDTVNNASFSSIQNSFSSTPAGNPQPQMAQTSEISAEQINYMLLQQLQAGRVNNERGSPAKQEISLNSQTQCRNILQLAPNSLPVTLLQCGIPQIMANPSMANQFNNKLMSQGSAINNLHQMGTLNYPYNTNYKLIGNIQNQAQRFVHDISINQLLDNSLNGKNTFSSPVQLLKLSDSSESQSCSQTQSDQQDNEDEAEEESNEDDNSENCKFQNNQQQLLEQNMSQKFNIQQNNFNNNAHSKDFQNQNTIPQLTKSKEIEVKQEHISPANPYNQISTKQVTIQQKQKKNSTQSSLAQSPQKPQKNKKKRSHIQEQEGARASIKSASTTTTQVYVKINNTKIEETDLLRTSPQILNHPQKKSDYRASNSQGYTCSQQNSSFESGQNYANTTSAENQGESHIKYGNKEFCETSSQSSYSSSSEEDVQDSPMVKKYCKFTSISNSSSDSGDNTKRKSEIIIVCSLKPKEKTKKSKKDYYNDSNYTKNLLKGFRRYMKRFSADQQIFQEFEKFFDTHQLNNELILKLFAHDVYQSYFQKFLSQPPLWWIQEAKIKDVEKQVGFFNLCRQRKFNSIKTKRKSFMRPQI